MVGRFNGKGHQVAVFDDIDIAIEQISQFHTYLADGQERDMGVFIVGHKEVDVAFGCFIAS